MTTGGGEATQITELDYTAMAQRAAKRNASEVTYYAGDHYQRTDDTTGRREHRYVVYAGGRPVAQVNRTQTGEFVAEKVRRYLHTDALGSIALITYDAAAPAHRSYGSFGRTSDFQDPEVVLGYTGHEHDLELGLINMNARMYDPISARFLTPDPMMSQPYGTGVNPYAYAGNSPIDRTDPTGMYWEKDRDVPYAIGAFFGLFAGGGIATSGGSGSGTAMGAAGLGFAALDTYANYLDNRAFTRRSYVGTQPASTATSSAQQVTPMPGSRTAGTDCAPGGAAAVGPPLANLLDEGTPEGLGLCDAGDCLAMRGARRPPRGAPIPGGGGPVLRPLRSSNRTPLPKPINLPAWDKVTIDFVHIMDRHAPGGRLAFNRTVFPNTMSPVGILRAIRQAYESGQKVYVQGTDRVLLQGQGGGLTIEMWFNKTSNNIETAYPIGPAR